VTFVVLTTSPGFGRAGDLPERLAATGWRLLHCGSEDPAPQLAMADALVAGLPAVTAATLAAAPRLRGVAKHGVGLDTIDIAACTARGVAVTSAPGANAPAVAELALAHLFALSRNLIAGHTTVTSGGWDRRIGREIAGATLGIVGFGAIGRTLASKALALGMKVLVADPFVDPAEALAVGARLLPLPDLLARADHVSLHVLGGPATAGLIGEAELARMKPGATILNLSRGQVLDLDALHHALTSGHLAGAAIDAYPVEPPDRSHPIFADPRVIFSPHSGADTAQALTRMGHMVIDDLETLFAGGRPSRTVNPECWNTAP
jgi:D-3-phosphoglycerate dehydrogenase